MPLCHSSLESDTLFARQIFMPLISGIMLTGIKLDKHAIVFYEYLLWCKTYRRVNFALKATKSANNKYLLNTNLKFIEDTFVFQ